MRYQCEVCGSEHDYKMFADSCEQKHKCDSVGHQWMYETNDESELTRYCNWCGVVDFDITLTQPDLADLWERKNKAKEATT